jgi:hypothetical protein
MPNLRDLTADELASAEAACAVLRSRRPWSAWRP